ncbi:M23 family metallopeptidase [Galbitalea sp. SE-J8]|uniref:M23 family metallopeptidase n=1 Tax=Galbitalea sp. SE-J8 TaxID=3054952 RepID=UPI00259C8AB8|nr:M23 family metallopeptidase [Galbitalea sp. SE-J8]MDM4762287.1 M23 family metallopeptidase [Galbitalea sp. SE-J8]
MVLVFAVNGGTASGAAMNDLHYGNYLRVTATTATLYSLYAHLYSQWWTNGQPVAKCASIGYTGSTGDYADGAHLHFSMAAHWYGWSDANTTFFDTKVLLANNGIDWQASHNRHDPYAGADLHVDPIYE